MRSTYIHHSILTAVLLVAVMMAGCAGTGRLQYDSPQEAYEKGKSLYDRGKYTRATEYLRAVFDFGRTHEWAADAQLYLARAYSGNKEYILAHNEFTRFIEIYRTDPRVPQADFERAMTSYARSPQYQLDQTDTQKAIQAFQLFINKYPNNELVAEAEAKIKELREKLARKQIYTSELYERREIYQAAALSYESGFDKYPDTEWADDALLGAIRSYIAYSNQSVRAKQPERLQKAIEHYERLVQLFPQSPLLKDAERLYEEATAQLADLSDVASG